MSRTASLKKATEPLGPDALAEHIKPIAIGARISISFVSHAMPRVAAADCGPVFHEVLVWLRIISVRTPSSTFGLGTVGRRALGILMTSVGTLVEDTPSETHQSVSLRPYSDSRSSR